MKLDKRKKITISSLIIILVIFSVGVLILNSGIKKKALRPTGGNTFAKAVVTKVITSNVNISDEGEMEGNQTVKIKITSGKYKNEECEAQSPYANHTGAFCKKGTHVIILVKKLDTGEFNASVYNYDRGIVQWIMIAAFLGVLCIVGGRRGVASAVGLVFTFVCIIGVYIPMLYIGVSPFISATVTTIMITIVVMMLIGGWTIKTLCAILGTIAGVLVAGGMAYLFGKLGHISGLNADDVETLAYVAQNSKLDVGGVLFSGILIASLGAVMDVSMSISSTIAEIHDANPEFDARRLFKSGINVGKDMMGTMSNTLILAFAGGSINILIITYAYNMSYLEYFNKYDIGIELLRGIAGSMGVILTVPFVSIIASILLKKKNKKIL
ncbi:YibE/F family protein [Eubacterium sp.]